MFSFHVYRDLLAEDAGSASTSMKQYEVQSLQECFDCLHSGVNNRSTRYIGTQLLVRSHSIVTLQVEKYAANSGKLETLSYFRYFAYNP